MFNKIKRNSHEHYENKQIFNQLSKENQKYLTDFIKFSLQKAEELSKDTRELTIYPDVIDVQKDGLTAENFFGMSAKDLAEQMVKELPNKNIYKPAILSGIFSFICFYVIALLFFRNNLAQSNYWLYIGFIALGTLINSLLRLWIGRLLIEKSQIVRRISAFIIQILVALFLIGGFYFLIKK
ncbi:hypothetical protein [Lactococcus sp.]|uniref:hypothetical protein n=1 Tax=Lactococcus sp. TaxID=44273 RepID=UPI002FC9099E